MSPSRSAACLAVVMLAAPAGAEELDAGAPEEVAGAESLTSAPLVEAPERVEKVDPGEELLRQPTPPRSPGAARSGQSPGSPANLASRLGPTVGFTVYNVHRLWMSSSPAPVVGLRLGARYAFLEEALTGPKFHAAVAATLAIESTVLRRGGVGPSLGGGVRVELCGSRPQPFLLPFITLAAFGQVVAPINGEPVIPRAGLSLTWNMAGAIPPRGKHAGRRSSWTGGGGAGLGLGGLGGAGSAAGIVGLLLLVPLVAAVAFVGFGEVQVYVQPDSITGQLVGGVGLGLAM